MNTIDVHGSIGPLHTFHNSRLLKIMSSAATFNNNISLVIVMTFERMHNDHGKRSSSRLFSGCCFDELLEGRSFEYRPWIHSWGACLPDPKACAISFFEPSSRNSLHNGGSIYVLCFGPSTHLPTVWRRCNLFLWYYDESLQQIQHEFRDFQEYRVGFFD